MVAEGTLPRNKQNFLRIVSNETQLFKFLSDAFLMWFNLEDKELVVTDGDKVNTKPTLSDLSLMAPCTHEEAESRMLLHVSHESRHGHSMVTVDTDVVVLAVLVVQHL